MEDEIIAFLTANLLAPFLQRFAKNAADHVSKRRNPDSNAKLTTQILIPTHATDLVYIENNICFVQSKSGTGKILSSLDLINWKTVYGIPPTAKLMAYIYQSRTGEWILCDGINMRILS